MDLSGEGVIVALLDNGFKLYDSHEAFDSLNVISTYDFVRDVPDVDDPLGGHGTNVLSVLASYSPGQLIGPAYGASFLLAQTEDNSDESPIEEDNWVAGLEWAELNGADIVTSSLGYGYYYSDPPSDSWYSWQELDGQTAITTQATIMAENYGLIVVNSAGNEGYSSIHHTLNAPADGEYVITVGGVTSSGNRVNSSSVGPTADGRIKPDVVAMGSNVRLASASNAQGYFNGSGTSFATPLVAGSIALILEAFPEATPQQIRSALRYTASQAGAPDNLKGWGIVNIKAVYDCFEEIDTLCLGGFEAAKSLPEYGNLAISAPNPFSQFTTIQLPENSRVEIKIFDTLGRNVSFISKNEAPIIQKRHLGASGIYFYTVKGVDGEGKRINKKGKLIFINN